MAIFTATAAQATVQPKGLRVGLAAVRAVFSLNASLNTGDVVQMVKVPAGATPVYIQYGSNVTSTFLMFEIGDGIATGRYKSMSTYSAGQGMLTAIVASTPYVYSADDTIDINISVATLMSLNGAVFMNVIFSMDATY